MMKVTIEHDGRTWQGDLQEALKREYHRFWPKGIWPWVYPGDRYWDTLESFMKVGGVQFWSTKYNPTLRPWPRDSVPYICEIQTRAGRPWDDPYGPEFERLVGLHAQSPSCFGMNLNCEVPWSEATNIVARILWQRGHKVFTGPMRHDPAEHLNDYWNYNSFPAILSWVNCWHRDRSGHIGDDFPEGDLWYLLALAARWDTALIVSVQPCRREGDVKKGKAIILPDPAKFQRVLQCAANYADGLMLWKAEQLCMALEGDMDWTGDLIGICAAVRTVKQTPLYREPLIVSFPSRTSDEYNKARVLTRAAARADFYPENYPDGGGLTFEDLPWSAYDKNIFDRFHQGPDHCDFDGTEGERLAEIEREKASWIQTQFGTPPKPVPMLEVT